MIQPSITILLLRSDNFLIASGLETKWAGERKCTCRNQFYRFHHEFGRLVIASNAIMQKRSAQIISPMISPEPNAAASPPRGLSYVWHNRLGGEKCCWYFYNVLLCGMRWIDFRSRRYNNSPARTAYWRRRVTFPAGAARARVRARVTSESDSRRDILILSGESYAASLLYSPARSRSHTPEESKSLGCKKWTLRLMMRWIWAFCVDSIQDVHAAFWPFTEFLNEINQITIRAVNRAKFHPRDI